MLKYVTVLGCYGMEESKLGLNRKGWHTIFLSLFVSSCYWFVSVSSFYWLLFPFCIAKLPNSFSCVLSAAFSSRNMEILDSIWDFSAVQAAICSNQLEHENVFELWNTSKILCNYLFKYCTISSEERLLAFHTALDLWTANVPSISSGRMYHHYL